MRFFNRDHIIRHGIIIVFLTKTSFLERGFGCITPEPDKYGDKTTANILHRQREEYVLYNVSSTGPAERRIVTMCKLIGSTRDPFLSIGVT